MTASRRDLLLAMLGAAARSDADLLAGLLERELALEAAYADALERGAIHPELGERLLRHEREHVRGLEQALGAGRPRATAPAPKLGIDFASRRAFASSALELEAEAVEAYQEVLTTFHNDRLLQPLGSIMACGAQHVVALREALGEELL